MSQVSTSSSIVKLTLSLAHHTWQMLAWDRDRSFVLQSPAGPEVLALMAGRVTAYFHAQFVEGELHLGDEALTQEW